MISINPMQQLPRPEMAEDLLRRLHNHVNELITKQGYNVKYLCEYYPEDGEYGCHDTKDDGDMINLRLRSCVDVCQFLTFYELMETLLHEITHCKVGPHNKAFHKLNNTFVIWYEKEWLNGEKLRDHASMGESIRKIKYESDNEEKRLAFESCSSSDESESDSESEIIDTIDTLKAEIDKLETNNKTNASRITNLKTQLTEQDQQLHELKDIVENLISEKNNNHYPIMKI